MACFASERTCVVLLSLRMLRDILKFNRQGKQLRKTIRGDMTVEEFVARFGYSVEFANHYLLPMGASIWSCPVGTFRTFPIRFILDFYDNHGLLSLRDRPVWRVIKGGSQQYVEALCEPYRHLIRTQCAVSAVTRRADGVVVEHTNGSDHFDEVILACHADQAMRMLSDASPTERSMLSEFPYTSSVATLHTDEALLPKSRRAWSSWNYHVRSGAGNNSTLTYNMNMLQSIESAKTFLVTLNSEDLIDPSKQIARFEYSHPSFTVRRDAVQSQHDQMIRRRRTSFCGAWWGAGFHEDGVNSALAVCRRFSISDWQGEVQSAAESAVPGKHPNAFALPAQPVA